MSRYRALALFVFLALAWGGSFVAIRAGLDYFPPVLFAALRFDIAAVLLLGYVAFRSDRWVPRTRGDVVGVALSGTLIVALNNALLFVGQQYVTSGVAAIIYALNPILSTAFAALLLTDERLSPLGLAGAALGLAGVAIIARPDPGALFAADVIGMALILIAATLVALGSVTLRRVEMRCSPLTMTAWAMVVGALCIHAISAGLGEPLSATLAPTAVVALAFLAVFTSAAGYAVYFDLLDRLGPIQINLISYVVPVVATVAGWALLGERIGPATVVGFVVIVVGFALVKRRALADEYERARTRFAI